MSERYLIVGLGNPGKKYENTRHNVGFWCVDELARRHNLEFSKTEKKALIADGIIAGQRVMLVKPQTYMNLSGQSVRGLVDFYKIDYEKIIIVHDDLDTDFGVLRLRIKGSSGGNNGMKDIINHLGTNDIYRAKIGIGRPPGRMNPADYVLKPFAGDDAITASLMVDRAADAIETWLKNGIELAMTRHNGVVDEKDPSTGG